MRRRIITVQPVQKDDTRFPVLPGLGNDPVKNFSRIERSSHLSVSGVDQFVVLIIFHGLHKNFRQSDGYVEIVQLFLIGLAHDEVHDIRVVDPQDPHISTPACSPLLDGFRSDIKDPHERDRTAGNACGGHDDVIGRAQSGKRESRPAARFMNKGGELDSVKYLFHGIPDGQDKTGGKLSQFASGVHEGWRVGKKFKPGHALVEGFRQLGCVCLFIEYFISPTDRLGDTLEHMSRGLQNFSLRVAPQIAPAQNR